MRYSRIGLWAVAVAVAVGVTTTVVATATGAAGREVLSEDGVAGALAAAQAAPAAPAPVGRSDASEAYRAGDEKLLQTAGGDIVASCDKDVLAIHSIAPKPGYRMLMVAIDRDTKVRALRWAQLVQPPVDTGWRITVGPTGSFSLILDQDSSEVSLKVTVTCVDGEPTAKESQIVKNYGAGKG
jgi:hypothetical protein